MQKKWHDCVLCTFIGNKGKHLSNSGKSVKDGSNVFIAIFAVQYTDRTKMKRRRIMAAIYHIYCIGHCIACGSGNIAVLEPTKLWPPATR